MHVDFPDGRQLAPLLIVTRRDSNEPFATALPTERTEEVLRGLCGAFDRFAVVLTELGWDDQKTVAIHISRG